MYESFDDYVSQYVSAVPFGLVEEIEQEIGDIHIKIMVMEYNDGRGFYEKAHVVLTRGEHKYECFCIHEHQWDELFSFLQLDGKQYLCFRKTLYGFTLIDAETLEEAYDYFPSQVLDGHESFIFLNAWGYRNFIVFNGCWWACPEVYYIYDYRNKKVLDVFETFSVFSHNGEVAIENDELVLECTDDDDRIVKLRLGYQELCDLMSLHGSANFD